MISSFKSGFPYSYESRWGNVKKNSTKNKTKAQLTTAQAKTPCGEQTLRVSYSEF